MLEPQRSTIRFCAASVLALLAGAASAGECDELADLAIAGTEITSAGTVAAGGFVPPGRFGGNAYADLPAFCRVEAIARPAAGSEIGIEVWLPAAGWNGKLEAVGNGAWAGSIGHAAMARGLAQGYATTSTDTGHKGGSADFALEHPDKLVDFAHRAVHEMAVTAKALVDAYYGRPEEHAYFTGCSTGGRQALTAAQRYPDDFDGIVAGAPAYYPSHIQGMQVYTAAVSNRNRAARIDEAEFALLNEASIAACDLIDGVGDGVIEDPRQCHFDPASLACPAAGGGACLGPEQVETARLVYRGPATADGTSLYPGLERGSELGWATLSSSTPLSLARETYGLLVHGDADWDWSAFDAETDMATAVDRIGPLMDSDDPDLDDFIEHGGKLILYHGWSDPGIPPRGTIRYYENVVGAVGKGPAGDAIRLYMVPGMNHCGGGTGTDQFDPVAALDRWIATDTPPQRIEAERRVDGETVRTRPLCAYPTVARYDGAGGTDAASSFGCR